ncbi:hypothetical protein A7P25_00940 [Achromobacter xylosoxidans]|nr:hypothetical protein A7P25_00940 [Achromobacter xylosoxidans]
MHGHASFMKPMASSDGGTQADVGARKRQTQSIAAIITDLVQLDETFPGNDHVRVVIKIGSRMVMQSIGPPHMHLCGAIVIRQHGRSLLLRQRWSDVHTGQPRAQGIGKIAENGYLAPMRH